MEILRELKEEADATRVRTERMGVVLTAILRKVKGLEEAEALRAKEANLQEESQGVETEDVLNSKE